MTGKYLNFAKQNYNNGFYECCNERMKEKMIEFGLVQCQKVKTTSLQDFS